MYKLINQEEADRIKDILLTTGLNNPINIETKENNIVLNAFSVSESNDSEHHPQFDMQEFYLLDEENNTGVIKYKNRFYDFFVNVGEWGYKTRLEKTHITMGSSKFHDFCFQIELSQAIKDKKNFYIVKNISNFAGAGAIADYTED